MGALVLGLVFAAAGSLSVDGALTAGVQLSTQDDAGASSASAHVRADVGREFGRFFAEARASILLSGPLTFSSLVNTPIRLADLGSHLTVGFRPGGAITGVALELRPLDTSVRFPAFDWANAWGLSPRYAPMAALLLSTAGSNFWLASRFEQGQVRDRQIRVFPSVLAGYEVALPESLRLELRGAFLQQVPTLGLLMRGVEEPLHTAGGGARFSYTWGEPVGPIIDLVTYATDPLRFERFFVSQPHRTARAGWFALEAGALAQERLPSLTDTARTLQGGWWFDAQARIRLGALRLFGTVRARPLIMFMDQSGVGEIATPPTLANGPSVSGLLGADYAFRTSRLLLGLLFNLTRPAWFEGLSFPAGVAVPSSGSRYVLNDGRLGATRAATVDPLLAVKMSIRWEIASFASAVSEIEFLQDLNRRFDEPPLGGRQLIPLSVRWQLFAQLRF